MPSKTYIRYELIRIIDFILLRRRCAHEEVIHIKTHEHQRQRLPCIYICETDKVVNLYNHKITIYRPT
jgi:hypothetical protein